MHVLILRDSGRAFQPHAEFGWQLIVSIAVLAWVQQSSVQWLKTNLPLETEVKFILKYYCEIQHRVFSRLQIGCQLWIFVTCRSVAIIYNYIKKKKKRINFVTGFVKVKSGVGLKYWKIFDSWPFDTVMCNMQKLLIKLFQTIRADYLKPEAIIVAGKQGRRSQALNILLKNNLFL